MDGHGPQAQGGRVTWLTVDEIIGLTGWTRAYVMKRASLDKWVRKGTKPQQYSAHSLISRRVVR